MANHTQVAASRAITVPFHGAALYVVEHHGQPYTPMKPIVEGMGIDWKGQHAKLAANEARWGMEEISIPTAGGVQVMACIALRKLFGWLAGIHVGKIKAEIRPTVLMYQNECDDVLWQYWNDGIVINPRAAYSVHSGQTLSAEQAETLRLLLTENIKKLPKTKQGGEMIKGWSKLKAHFKTDYRHIPAGEFHEAVNILARHVAEWEFVDDAPKAGPAIDLGINLPRLIMTMRPPTNASYKYDCSNPYPRDGRTIEVAKSIVSDIGIWVGKLPAGPAKRDLAEATDTLYRLLVSGCTEVDEALGQLNSAMHHLNRWQGRGGRLGNMA